MAITIDWSVHILLKLKRAKNPTNFTKIILHTESGCDIGGDSECKVGGTGAAKRRGEPRAEQAES
ncbi:hypothetical protein FH972_002233 [Carpinus fangiana]|uniref:Uncharacterized protein n=1 Tax=Carpinus fangiana TaxID=176857 RepID=A0A5N6QEL2_9ROSI|nr:hypothetical protein FH972_002233 [Carpinus fangiana]